MPMVWSRVDDDMDIFAIQNFSEITDRRRPLAIFGVLLGKFGCLILLHVAEGNDISVTRRILQIAATHSAATDQCDSGPVVQRGQRGSRLFGRFREFAFDKPEWHSG